MTTSSTDTSTACRIRAPKNDPLASGVPLVRRSTPESRWTVIATAMLLKQTVIARAGWAAVPNPRLGQLAVAERCGWSLGDDVSGHDHRDAVGEELRFVHVVGGEQHGHAERRQVLDHFPRLVTGRGVKAGRRLVEEQQFWIADEGNRDVQPALLAAGELEDAEVALLFEAHQIDHFIHWPRMRIKGGVHRDRLAHGQIPINARGVQHDPDAALQLRPLTAGIHSEYADVAVVAGPVALENLDRGGLARTVRAQQREHLAVADRQVDTPDNRRARVGLHQAVNVNRQPARHRVSGCRTQGYNVGGRPGHKDRLVAFVPSNSVAFDTVSRLDFKNFTFAFRLTGVHWFDDDFVSWFCAHGHLRPRL